MKKTPFITTLAFTLIMLVSFNLSAQDFAELNKSPMDAAAFPTDYKNPDKLIKVVYSRPQLKERSLDKLAPNGKVWRTGANEATEITLYTDMKLGSTLVKAGTYSLATIPGEKEWTIILNKDLNTWGSYFYNEANDVARITVPVGSSKKSIEAFSIAFKESDKGVDMFLGWDTTVVAVPFTK
ncbi:DUF2911 domain-containing protein [Lacinutrix sp. WUR7]|uniref:DUF2911 domain-containing protein n=1 Tax=Lacinutrix TaxID=291183 RepID=UPI0006E3A348|nr:MULTISPECIES: DUF2911 domain-containing protein [Lacinutrix]QRM87950.1 DUF2911 domain-containing protein [Lacinutrix sp. WUR7]